MFVSIVIATYNRKDILSRTLQKLAEQTYPPDGFEVVVSDDGSTDGTGEMVASLASKVPYTLRHVSHENRGVGATQNHGIREARGELLVLMAEDIQATPSMLESYVRFHEQHPEAHIASLGKVLQSPDLPKTAFLQHWDPFIYSELEGTQELPYYKFWTSCIALKRSFLLEHGLFAEPKGVAHEDVELGWRLTRKGLRIFYLPGALAYHYHVETLEKAIARAYHRGLNWWVVADSVSDPEIFVKYQVLNLRTLKYYYWTFKNRANSTLPGRDRLVPWLLFRQFAQGIVFNQFTVPFWIWLLNKAEHNPKLASLLPRQVYRGTVFCHFRMGARRISRERSKGGSTFPASRQRETASD